LPYSVFAVIVGERSTPPRTGAVSAPTVANAIESHTMNVTYSSHHPAFNHLTQEYVDSILASESQWKKFYFKAYHNSITLCAEVEKLIASNESLSNELDQAEKEISSLQDSLAASNLELNKSREDGTLSCYEKYLTQALNESEVKVVKFNHLVDKLEDSISMLNKENRILREEKQILHNGFLETSLIVSNYI
jgi:septal ring factor EnvC (AmiA/AmiB activator)